MRQISFHWHRLAGVAVTLIGMELSNLGWFGIGILVLGALMVVVENE